MSRKEDNETEEQIMIQKCGMLKCAVENSDFVFVFLEGGGGFKFSPIDGAVKALRYEKYIKMLRLYNRYLFDRI